MAGRVGFEPTGPLRPPVFRTGALSQTMRPPRILGRITLPLGFHHNLNLLIDKIPHNNRNQGEKEVIFLNL